MMPELSIDQVMTAMPDYFSAELAEGLTASVQIHFTGEGASDWTVEIANGACKTARGTIENPAVTLTAEGDDFLALLDGTLQPMPAFMRGKLKLKGDVALAMKLPAMFRRPEA